MSTANPFAVIASLIQRFATEYWWFNISVYLSFAYWPINDRDHRLLIRSDKTIKEDGNTCPYLMWCILAILPFECSPLICARWDLTISLILLFSCRTSPIGTAKLPCCQGMNCSSKSLGCTILKVKSWYFYRLCDELPGTDYSPLHNVQYLHNI